MIKGFFMNHVLTKFTLVLVLAISGCGGSNSSDSSNNDETELLSRLDWPIEDGYYDTANTTFTLPETTNSSGHAYIYYIDVQSSFPDVDWDNLDRLYIPAGQYSLIRLGNLPQRSSSNPLIITNSGGQVRVGGLGHYYLMNLSGGSNWILTGRYDAQAETGDIDYPGHRGGNFANTQGTYGILIDDDFLVDGNSGLDVSDATGFTVEYLEIREVGFAGMTMKTDDDGDAIMQGVTIHDNYIHDTGSEGLYIGSTQTQPQHQISDWEIYNNRVLRTGTEAIQLGQLAGETKVHHNVFGPAAIDWRDAFQTWQDNNFQIGIREGHLRVYNNVFLGSAGSMISLFAKPVEGDESADNIGITMTDNYFNGMRSLAMFINPEHLDGMSYLFENNSFGGYRFDRDEVYSSATQYDHFFRTFNSDTPISFINNSWYGPETMTMTIDNNGSADNITATGNNNAEPEAINFVDSGLPEGLHILDVEMWTDRASLGDNVAVDYQQGDLVTYLGIAYQCALEVCESGNVPTQATEVWTELGYLPDDVRVTPGSSWQHIGIMPQ